MNKEELLKKWLDNNLTAQELKAFEQLDDFAALQKLDNTLKQFKADAYDSSKEFKFLTQSLKTKKARYLNNVLIKIAALLLITYSVYYYSSNLDTTTNTHVAQKIELRLPDTSIVNINSMSSISFNKRKWNTNRNVTLNGEAYFKVSKGSKFNVITKEGVISVLGTEFNVKQRENYFEVSCYEGLVSVDYKGTETKLKPGMQFLAVNNSVKHLSETKSFPSWIYNESTFSSTALKHVLAELQLQYNISIKTNTIDQNQLFSGSFSHDSLELALKSITRPLGITYSINNTEIVLNIEQ